MVDRSVIGRFMSYAFAAYTGYEKRFLLKGKGTAVNRGVEYVGQKNWNATPDKRKDGRKLRVWSRLVADFGFCLKWKWFVRKNTPGIVLEVKQGVHKVGRLLSIVKNEMKCRSSASAVT